MFKEVLLITPKLEPGDLNNMEKSLSRRFGKIAKTFGKGLGGAILGGGFVGAAVGLVDKLLNPLKETQDAIDRTLKQGDDVVTNAKQFGTTAGKLLRLQALAKSTGLDEGSLDILINKFQGAVADAKQDPSKPSAVRQFVGEKDMADAFFGFIQSLQKLDKNQQVLVQQEVFGEKQILKMADFLQTDFAKQSKALGGPSATVLDKAANKVGDLNDMKDLLTASRDLNDFVNKSKLINADMIKSQDQQIKQELTLQNASIQSYKDLATISMASNEILNTVKELTLKLTSIGVQFTNLMEVVKYWKNSSLMKGIMKWMPGSGD